MRERVDLKSPVRENRPPGSVRGAPGNRRPYRDREGARGAGPPIAQYFRLGSSRAATD